MHLTQLDYSSIGIFINFLFYLFLKHQFDRSNSLMMKTFLLFVEHYSIHLVWLDGFYVIFHRFENKKKKTAHKLYFQSKPLKLSFVWLHMKRKYTGNQIVKVTILLLRKSHQVPISNANKVKQSKAQRSIKQKNLNHQ